MGLFSQGRWMTAFFVLQTGVPIGRPGISVYLISTFSALRYLLIFQDDQTVFVGTESGIFKSHNGGLGWIEVNFPLEYAPVLSLALSPRFSQDNSILVGTENAGLFSSMIPELPGNVWQAPS